MKIILIISSQVFLPKEYMNMLLLNINLSPIIILGFLYYFIFGFLLYAFLIACVGATVTKQEEIQQAQTPFSLLLMIGFYLSIFSSNSKGLLNTVATYLPLSSPFINTMNLLSRKLSLIDMKKFNFMLLEENKTKINVESGRYVETKKINIYKYKAYLKVK